MVIPAKSNNQSQNAYSLSFFGLHKTLAKLQGQIVNQQMPNAFYLNHFLSPDNKRKLKRKNLTKLQVKPLQLPTTIFERTGFYQK